jgi:hypothetical protein|tara:strand:- start:13237 stop:13446 length:210 start_codon:yes stop_codon:yes gene_type:complete
MENKKDDLPKMLDIFKESFSDEMSPIGLMIDYEILILEIEMAITEYSNDVILGGKIRTIMSKWESKNKK